MMVRFYRAKTVLEDESEEKKEVTNTEIVGMISLEKVVMLFFISYFCLVMHAL